MDLPSWIYPVKRLVTSEKVGQWCLLPYIDHPGGCPNYGIAAKCPPHAPAVGKFFDLSKPLWLVHSEFNLAIHIAKMEKKHPEWTLRQCKCVLYWQSISRKQLKERVQAALFLGANRSTLIPEAIGVNVFVTARIAGLQLEPIKRLSICRHVAMIGSQINGQMSLF